jgi:hypothetical protein
VERPEHKLLRDDWSVEPELAQDEDFALPDDEGMEAVRLAHRSGFRLLRQEPGLAFWVVGADMLSSVLRVLPILVLLMGVVAVSAGHDPSTSGGLVAWGVGVVRWLMQPATVVGTLGMFAAVLAAGWILSVATTSGVLGALRHRLYARTFIRQGMFFKHFGAGFTRLLWWDTLRTAVVGAFVALMVLAMMGTLRQLVAAAPHGHWTTPSGSLVVAGLLALVLTLGTVASLVLAAVFHLALGPMVIRDSTVGEAVAEAVELIRQRPFELLILYVLVGVLFGVVACVYAPFYAVAVTLASDPATESIASFVQLGADMFLLIGGSAATVWARGSVLSYVAMRDGVLARLPPVPRHKRVAPQKPEVEPSAQPEQAPMDRTKTPRLADLLPASYPNIFTYGEGLVRVAVVDGGGTADATPAEGDGGLGDAEDNIGERQAGHDDAGVELDAGDHDAGQGGDDEDHALAAHPDLLERPKGDVGDHQARQDDGEQANAEGGVGVEGSDHRSVGEDDGDQ